MDPYSVPKIGEGGSYTLSVPASKSILNRALILAAFSEGDIFLKATGWGEDSDVMLSCLNALRVAAVPSSEGILVRGGALKTRCVALNVGNAGTVARFLTAALAYHGGDFLLYASDQMSRRPMELLPALQKAGVSVEYSAQPGHFPFRMRSEGLSGKIEVEASTSTQYASGLMLAAATGEKPFAVTLGGSSSRSAYIDMTLGMIRAFGGDFSRIPSGYSIEPIGERKPSSFNVEPDVSAACYFYALALLLRAKVAVRDVHFPPKEGENAPKQGDLNFLDLLADRGVTLCDGADGIEADGRDVKTYRGFDVDMSEFSDQALTVAALAPFADTPTRIRNIGHIRGQECDRIDAIVKNLTTLGVPCRSEGGDVFIEPAPVHSGVIRTFSDHRVAMAFSLIGLKQGGIAIDDPACCKKTFPRFFDIIETLA